MNEIDGNICDKTKKIINSNTMDKNQVILCEVYPPFRPLLKRVLESNQFGIACATVELIEVTSSLGNIKGDRFSITVPYAKQTLHWIVMFDAAHPEIGPDFEFNDKTFFSDPNIDMLEKFVPSLMNWNFTDENCLMNVLVELLLCYKYHQKEQLDERLEMEYSSLIEQTDICNEDVELILLPNSTEPIEAHFLIRIAADVSKLPKKNSSKNQFAVMLHVTFQGVNWQRIIPNLYFSSSLSNSLGNINNLHIPQFPSNKTLMDYVPEVKRMIDDKINAVVTNYEMRKNYINAWLHIQGRSVIEYDASDFNYLVVLFDCQDFYFLVHINLPLEFPHKSPEVMLQSIYNVSESDNELFKYILNFVPHSPRWNALTMVIKELEHIYNNEFKIFKIKSTRLRLF